MSPRTKSAGTALPAPLVKPSEPVDVLVVDDNDKNLLAIEAVLAPLGQTIVLKRSGADALRWLLRSEAAVVLLDVRMPEVDGFETALAIRERDRSRHTPIIFITAIDTDPTKMARGYSMGAVDFLFKPVVPEILRSKVAVFVELHQRRREIAQQARALEKRTRELARSNAELAQFAYVASHDLQEPLRKVTGFAKLLAEELEGKIQGEPLAHLRVVQDAVQRMQRMIQDLLSYARAGQGESVELTSLDAALDSALERLETAVVESRAVVAREPLPSVRMHPLEAIQLFQNLVSNALKFRRTEPPRVHISAAREGGEWIVTVRDNGIGIPGPQAAELFQVFRRLHSRTAYPGTGIGLATCRKIAESLGGRIWVEPAPDEGSTFRVAFPAPDDGSEH
jgi:two-component system, sensor histidine kinase and response regulator